jgi:hypothetical protein
MTKNSIFKKHYKIRYKSYSFTFGKDKLFFALFIFPHLIQIFTILNQIFLILVQKKKSTEILDYRQTIEYRGVFMGGGALRNEKHHS